MIFISSPYTHKNKKIQQKRLQQVGKMTAHLVSNGEIVFSPIVYGLELCKYQSMPTDFEFWKSFCEKMILKSDAVYVLRIDGYLTSKGVIHEVQFATKFNIPVKYIDYLPF